MSEAFCSDCKRQTEVVFDHFGGDTVCSECGLVLESHSIDETSEWRIFANESGDNDLVRVGGPTNPPSSPTAASPPSSPSPTAAPASSLSSSLAAGEPRLQPRSRPHPRLQDHCHHVQQVFLVGKDFGARPAHFFSVLYPERVLGVVMLGVLYAHLPSWFTEEDLAAYGALYEKSGFQPALQIPYRCRHFFVVAKLLEFLTTKQ
ncbi:hypothetical protein Fmac_001903 [Flemingia macrophylla]|uniref:TFIIB-type domain-containing protein n=1 Tax=Flemingia macrophylla TaxID=520843 RepID=A0ABD1NJ80_9FABA